VDGEDLSQKSTNLKTIRQKVGLVFQYPEDQFFEETVFDEVAFGLRNMGLDEDSISERVRYSLSVVGLDAKDLEGRSPFRLSGGQKRRLAIASVLAMKPKVLILDEPTAGLDPGGKRKIMDSIYSLHLRVGMTVVLVTHDIEMLCRYAKRVIVMHNGAIALDGPTAKVFWERDKLREIGLRPPEVVLLVQKLRDKGFHLDSTVVTVEQARKAILEHFGRTADA
jgi:energy-coupling factor transport system ATP-binding protein